MYNYCSVGVMICLVLAFMLLQLVCCQDVITTIAGSSTSGGYSGDNGAATSATLNSPFGVALDASGTITIPALCRAVTQYVAHLVMSLECRKLILHFPSRQRVHR